VQHSTGSGKSNTIAWLAYKLFSLHDDNDKPMFDGIVVLSDRVGIVNQLGSTIRQFEQVPGIVELVETTSRLAENLETERKILISTQQKFPVLSEKLIKLKGKYFAIIIEAHSSQTGESATKVKAVLTANLEEAAYDEAKIEESQYDLVDKIEKQIKQRGPQKNLSYYAFTATPKYKTFKIFGTAVSGDRYEPFHKYSMKQAIEEGFIFDVLKNYTTYERYFRIIQIASEDKVVTGRKASSALMKYVDTHHLNLSYKVEKIVEHFRIHCQPKIAGLAKAMVIASSRVQAMKYKQEIDSYILSQNYVGIKTLVAFSGTIQDEDGNSFTEQNVNRTSNEWELRQKFNSPEYNILIVAEKYQTGYDQPLLHTLYIDKKLHGIKVVQTLSRINRIHAGKTDTFVMDFQNTVEKIIKYFEPYYKGSSLVDKTDPIYLFKLYHKLINYGIITDEDLDKFAEVFFKPRSFQETRDHGRLYALINPVLDRFDDAKEIDKDEFKQKLIEYIDAYS
jgi:type I restriction enzyme R subunit